MTRPRIVRTTPQVSRSTLVEPVEALLHKPGTRYLISKADLKPLVERVMASEPNSVVKVTAEEMRMWVKHVVVVNG